MMKLYYVFDSVAQVYTAPFAAPNDAVALRSFTAAVNTPGHSFGENPEDFSLMVAGDFDEVSGEIIPVGKPVTVAKALAVRLSPGADSIRQAFKVTEENLK